MGSVIYSVLVSKSMMFEVEAETEDEACALAITVALGQATPCTQQQVKFSGKQVKIDSCREKDLDSVERGQ